jgi:hypothetical protein
MVELIVLNSNLTVAITLQNWPMDTVSPFADSLIRKGFTVNRPTAIQQMQVTSGPFAAKGTTSALAVDYAARRILLQITNNITSPQENVGEVLLALTSIGYPPQESIERIDTQGVITIKTQGEKATSFVPNKVDGKFITSVGEIFGRQVKAVGIRLMSVEPFIAGAAGSPFIMLLEPLFNDPSDSKLGIHLTYATNNSENAMIFLEHLYDRLKSTILELKTNG